jgi:transposase
MTRVQVFTGVERRRRWSVEQKQAIVRAAFSPGAVVTEVARRADVNSGQIYRWRDELRDTGGFGGSLGFARVMVTAGGPSVPARPESMIEIVVGDGTQVRLPVSASPDLAAAVVRALVWS